VTNAANPPAGSAAAPRTPITAREFDFPRGRASLSLLAAEQTLAFGVDDFPAEVVKRAALAGVMEILARTYTARRTNPQEAFAATMEKLTQLTNGVWGDEADAAKPRSALETAIAARAEAKGLDPAFVAKVVAAWTDEQRTAFVAQVKSDPLTAAIYARMRAGKPAIDLDAAGV
jgi:hypothetical protein